MKNLMKELDTSLAIKFEWDETPIESWGDGYQQAIDGPGFGYTDYNTGFTKLESTSSQSYLVFGAKNALTLGIFDIAKLEKWKDIILAYILPDINQALRPYQAGYGRVFTDMQISKMNSMQAFKETHDRKNYVYGGEKLSPVMYKKVLARFKESLNTHHKDVRYGAVTTSTVDRFDIVDVVATSHNFGYMIADAAKLDGFEKMSFVRYLEFEDRALVVDVIEVDQRDLEIVLEDRIKHLLTSCYNGKGRGGRDVSVIFPDGEVVETRAHWHIDHHKPRHAKWIAVDTMRKVSKEYVAEVEDIDENHIVVRIVEK